MTAEHGSDTPRSEAEQDKAETGPDAGAATELPPLAAKADDLDALRGAVVDAANVGAGLWISYLFVLLYLLVAAGSVTHKDLLLESPVRLPFLGVDLPLTGFFVLGPVMFLIVHAYVLLHFVMLANKVAAFDLALREQISSIDLRTRLRRQLPSNIFVQYLAGPAEIRDGAMGFMLWLIALISLVIGPICLLLFTALQFLPYHDATISWWQRVGVGIELALLWMFWPKIALRKAVIRGDAIAAPPASARAQRSLTLVAMSVLSGASIVLMLCIATFPGEALHDLSWHPCAYVSSCSKDPSTDVFAAARRFVVEGDVDPLTGRTTTLWSNRLVLPGLNVLEQKKIDFEARIAELSETASFRGRDMVGAVLIGAVLRKVDFMGTLDGARLDRADLREVKFQCGHRLKNDGTLDTTIKIESCARLRDASMNGARLTGALLNEARLDRASFIGADLRNAILDDASVTEANLRNADLRGSRLMRANLITAHLEDARAGGAAFDDAQMNGASLSGLNADAASFIGTDLRGASFNSMVARGATFRGSRLEGVHLFRTKLVAATFLNVSMGGARLASTDLTAASIRDTDLQGAEFDGTQLAGASLHGVLVWRTTVNVSLDGAKIEAVATAADINRLAGIHCGKQHHHVVACPSPGDAFARWLNDFARSIPDGSAKEGFVTWLKLHLDPDAASGNNTETAEMWRTAEQAAEARLPVIAAAWTSAGCDKDGAPVVMTSLVATLEDASTSPFGDNRDYPRRIAQSFLANGCEGAKGLTGELRDRLMKLSDAPSNRGTLPGTPLGTPLGTPSGAAGR